MNAMERGFDAMRNFYGRTLTGALEHPRAVMLVLAVTVALNFYLYTVVAKGFFPQQDTGTLVGNLRADQSISFQAMSQKLREVQTIVQSDPAVQDVVGFTGGGGGGSRRRRRRHQHRESVRRSEAAEHSATSPAIESLHACA
jgi:multidrug efflux pump subunit AcrB